MSEVVKAILRAVSSSLQIPTIIILILLILLTILMLGSIIAEIFTERKSLKMNIPELVDQLQGKTTTEMKEAIEKCSLLTRQKEAARELINRGSYPDDTREALARQLIADEEMRYSKIVKITDLTSRVAPMFGLMGTLIPLGPGLIALGQGDTSTLSSSLLIAFDTTVAGLISGAVCYVISGIRKGWYEEYMVGLETIMETILDVQSDERTKVKETIDDKKAKAEDGKSAAKAGQLPKGASAAQQAAGKARPGQPGAAGQTARPGQPNKGAAQQAAGQARPQQGRPGQPGAAGQPARPAQPQAGAAGQRRPQAAQQMRPQAGAQTRPQQVPVDQAAQAARLANPATQAALAAQAARQVGKAAGIPQPQAGIPTQPGQQGTRYPAQTIVQNPSAARPQAGNVPTGTSVHRTLQEEVRAAELALKQAEQRAGSENFSFDPGEDVTL